MIAAPATPASDQMLADKSELLFACLVWGAAVAFVLFLSFMLVRLVSLHSRGEEPYELPSFRRLHRPAALREPTPEQQAWAAAYKHLTDPADRAWLDAQVRLNKELPSD